MVLILCSVVMDSPLLNSIHFREKKIREEARLIGLLFPDLIFISDRLLKHACF